MSRNRQKAPPAEPAADAPVPAEADPPHSLPWKTLSVAGVVVALLVVFGVYTGVQRQLSLLNADAASLARDLRGELGALSKEYVGLVKKEEHSTRMKNVWDTVKELRADRTDLTMMKERCTVMLDLFKASEADRKDFEDQIRKLRERSRGDEEKKDLERQIRFIKERVGQLEGRQGVATDAPADAADRP
ncbi:MAG: hypothetical protein ACRC33_13435 [Gemmataceae bacterium]